MANPTNCPACEATIGENEKTCVACGADLEELEATVSQVELANKVIEKRKAALNPPTPEPIAQPQRKKGFFSALALKKKSKVK